MLAQAGLVEGTDYTTVGIEGFDPLVHIELPGLAAFTGYKSNEPGQLERAGVHFALLDPSEANIPGTFGILYTNAGFINDHPTAAQDFVRAAMRGMEDAIADPDAASQTAVDLINANGNPRFLSPEGEQFRWRTESDLVVEFTPEGEPVGLIHPADLQAQIDAYDAIGIFTAKPPIEGTYDDALIADVYGSDGKVIWPVAASG
jgi:NitT/TauT family transport system substrate-binding protein